MKEIIHDWNEDEPNKAEYHMKATKNIVSIVYVIVCVLCMRYERALLVAQKWARYANVFLCNCYQSAYGWNRVTHVFCTRFVL